MTVEDLNARWSQYGYYAIAILLAVGELTYALPRDVKENAAVAYGEAALSIVCAALMCHAVYSPRARRLVTLIVGSSCLSCMVLIGLTVRHNKGFPFLMGFGMFVGQISVFLRDPKPAARTVVQ